MKKQFLLFVAVMAAVVMTSCENNELAEINDRYEQAISRSADEEESLQRGEHERLNEYLERIRKIINKK